MALDVMSFGVTRKTWSGRCLGSSCIFPSYLPTSNHFPIVLSYPATAHEGNVSSFLLCRLFITAMTLTSHLVTQHHFHGKFPVVGWPLLAYQSIGWRDTLTRLGKFLEKRFIIFEQAFLDNIQRNWL